MQFKKQFQSIWANLDPNGHMRHTAYNDYAAQLRLIYFEEHGFPFSRLMEIGIGPVLFREETRFMQEIRMGEKLEVDVQLLRARKDASKWSFRQHVYKFNGEISAVIEVDGAWLDLRQRKIIVPPAEIQDMLVHIPKADVFEWLPEKKA